MKINGELIESPLIKPEYKEGDVIPIGVRKAASQPESESTQPANEQQHDVDDASFAESIPYTGVEDRAARQPSVDAAEP